MNKIYQRIDWENYPSSATPLNEDNLNKMDYAIDKLDDRIVTHETTKLNTATGNTLVKNVTFNEKTGVFTIEKLSGSKITINTALEKISTNFHFNPTTQKLVLTLIDGTVQEIDLSALITQYEFSESDTITFEIDASGKVKANILNGSITGEKLEPNYLANVTLQAKNAKTSADNAKTSEELAYQYAEEARESASQTAKSDAKNITYDNTESGLSATNVKDALDEVAQGSVSAIATDTTITDSTNAPLVRLKVKGKTEQFTTSGKNKLKVTANDITAYGITMKVNEDKSVTLNGTATQDFITKIGDFNDNDDNYLLSGCPSGGSTSSYYLVASCRDENNTWKQDNIDIGSGKELSNDYAKRIIQIGVKSGVTVLNLTFYPMIREATITDGTYEPFTNGASPNPDYPQEIIPLAKNGSVEVKTCGKNVLNNTASSKTLYGITVTVNDNKSVTLDGTATQDFIVTIGKFNNIDDNYILSGCPSGGSTSSYYLVASCRDENNEWKADDLELGNEKKLSNDYAKRLIQIGVKSGATVPNLTFYPMIRKETITDNTYEPYTETTATIPTDAPLYEGDYLEVYADGSGVLHRKMAKVVFDGDEEFPISGMLSNDNRLAVYYNPLDAKISIDGVNSISNQLKRISCTEVQNDETKTGFFVGDARYNPNHSFIVLVFPSTTATDLSTLQTWLQSNPVTVVYELAEPTETPLTAEQVEQFKKLYTFELFTNVFCDGEVEIQYYKNTPGGVAMATVHKKSIAMETVDIISGICEWRTGTNITANLNDITYGRGMFVAVGSSGATYFSYDGAVWQTVSNSITETLRAVTYGAGKFVAVGYDGATYYSSSGIVWEAGSGATANFYDVAYGNGVWVAVGYEPGSSGGVVYYSTDGIKWNVGSSFSSSLSHITYGGGKFVIFPGSSTYYSSDGITWTESSVPVSISNAVYSNGKFLAVGVNSCIYYSTDGMNWSVGTSSSPTESTLRCMTYGDGVFVGIDIDDNIYYSYDGLTWHLILNAVGTLYAVTYGANSDGVNRFVSVGYGNVYYSNIIKESKKITDVINELYSLLK